ncbi:hypothetical protein ACFWTC_24115 [Streptomyces sp. NPDC058619]|uniref:hypothetical protein n=1 Tax=unclassified Streptomyces TaxID=2593676 RepID=UPI00366828AA
MGAIRTSATALLSAGATGAVLALGALGAPAAHAAEAAPVTSFGFTLTPSTVAPGGQVVLAVTGCDAAFATSSSGVFDTVSIARGRTARVTVDRDARRGAQYSVSFTCNGETGSTDLTITGGTSSPTTSSTTTATATATVTATATPHAARTTPAATRTPTRTALPTAAAGTATGSPVGTRTAVATAVRTSTSTGTLTSARGVRGGLGGSVAGLDPVELGAGAGLLLASAGGTAYALRRRRGTGRGH